MLSEVMNGLMCIAQIYSANAINLVFMTIGHTLKASKQSKSEAGESRSERLD